MDAAGNVIFAFVQGKDIHIEIREPDGLKVLKRIEYTGLSGTEGFIVIKVVASRVTNRFAIVLYSNVPSTQNQLVLLLYESDGLYRNYHEAVLVDGSGVAFSRIFDACERPDTDSFILAYQDGSGGDLNLDEITFDGDVTNLDTAADETPYDAGPMFSCYAGPSTGRFSWAYSGMTDGTVELRSGVFGGGTVQTQTLTDREPMPAPTFIDLNNSTTAFLVCDPLERAISVGWPFTQLYEWDHTDNSRFARGTDIPLPTNPPSDSGFDGWNREAPVSQPVKYGTGPNATIQWASTNSTIGLQTECYVNQCDSDETVHTDAILHAAGVRYRNPDGSNAILRLDLYSLAAMPRPLRYALNGIEQCIYPLMIDSGRTSIGAETSTQIERVYTAVWSRVSAGTMRGKNLRKGVAYIPGGTLHVFDGERCLQGFMHPPAITVDFTAAGEGNPGLTPGEVIFITAVFEYVDANGRLWRSAAADIQELTVPTAGGDNLLMSVNVTSGIGLTGQGNGAQVVVYASNIDETTMFRRWVFQMEQGKWNAARGGAGVGFSSFDDAPSGTQVLYTADGTLGNDPPPACEFVTATRSRIWAGGLAERSWIQASKPLADTLAAEWSNLDSFKVFMSGDVTGLAAMDDTVVAFTKDQVFLIGGSGPDGAGQGTFGEPQLVPGSSGCIDHKSVISTEEGVFYQSLRGIELLPRGFASPVWVGQNVVDTLKDFPFCFGVCQSPVDWSVRWLFGDNVLAPTDSRVIVYDLRAKSWYVFDYEEAFTSIGTCVGRDGSLSHTAMFLANSSGAHVEDYRDGREALSSHDAWSETGDLRVAGLQSWAFGRRAHILGHFGGRDCAVTLQYAYDGKDWLAQDTYTWTLTQAERGTDVPVELELVPRRLKFSSIRFRLKVVPLSDGTDSLYSFKPNGLTLYYTPAAEGPRLAARDRG
jgi:hypothetical protein